MTMSEYIEVEPLVPPFYGAIVKISFKGAEKILAVSQADFDRICNFLGTDDPADRDLMLWREPGSDRIRIAAVQ
jgi:hypothetical protein